MALTVADVMTRDPVTVDVQAPVLHAAEQMRKYDLGAVIVQSEGHPVGILTDRDIVVRAIAEHHDVSEPAAQFCSDRNLQVVGPQTPIQEAVRIMREAAVRRLPVVDGESTVGIVSLGDIAIENDEQSALASISAAEPNS